MDAQRDLYSELPLAPWPEEWEGEIVGETIHGYEVAWKNSRIPKSCAGIEMVKAWEKKKSRRARRRVKAKALQSLKGQSRTVEAGPP